MSEDEKTVIVSWLERLDTKLDTKTDRRDLFLALRPIEHTLEDHGARLGSIEGKLQVEEGASSTRSKWSARRRWATEISISAVVAGATIAAVVVH